MFKDTIDIRIFWGKVGKITNGDSKMNPTGIHDKKA
jgi:hypothetical protein